MIWEEIKDMKPMTEEAALKWCEESAYQSLCEDTAENILDNIPEAIQTRLLAWAEDRLYASLHAAGKIKEPETHGSVPGGIWEDLIGQYSVRDILEYLEDEASALYGLTLGEAIDCIVNLVYDDTDLWTTSPGYREFVRAAYPDKDAVIRTIKEEVKKNLGLE